MVTNDGGWDTTASMVFIKPGSWPSDEKPYELLYIPTDESPTSNYEVHTVPNIPVRDMRPSLEALDLDRHGFIVASLASALRYENIRDEKALRDVYAAELRHLLLETLGARAVFIHECVLRKRPSDAGATHQGYGQPIPIAHTDYTPGYVHKLVDQLVPGEKASLVKDRRFQMLNVWKPLRGPLRDWPLALCDLQSLQPEHLVALDEVHAQQSLESQHVLYDPAQRWHYLSNQQAHELLIFKAADSVVPGEVPHASFLDPRAPTDGAPRESIEFRVLVVY
ncbi:uncharacterized protein PV07_00773 [Cladophialophora immunda]|uniref:Methyltransferase n=1 Tax=Cladophialophora immunda TaxID=569365 RepID=A0A0D2B8J2_9EURO|nr:uncharacterized protein PV07_00773 [Cladophialophora immunda]KIW33962.1 hypothetical protein PV07_00773 [Cladophialophora immunda]